MSDKITGAPPSSSTKTYVLVDFVRANYLGRVIIGEVTVIVLLTGEHLQLARGRDPKLDKQAEAVSSYILAEPTSKRRILIHDHQICGLVSKCAP
jgi:hypothetical protein